MEMSHRFAAANDVRPVSAGNVVPSSKPVVHQRWDGGGREGRAPQRIDPRTLPPPRLGDVIRKWGVMFTAFACTVALGSGVQGGFATLAGWLAG